MVNPEGGRNLKTWTFIGGRSLFFAVVLAIGLIANPSLGLEALSCPVGTELREGAGGEGFETWCAKVVERDHATKHGPYRSVYPSGQPRIEGGYENGVRAGTWRAWNDHGVLTGETAFLNDVNDGRSVLYFENGRPKLIGYSKRGKREGEWTRFFENGSPEREERYTEGVLDGAFKSYFEGGQVRQHGQYQHGEGTGRWTAWYENGTKAEEGSAARGLRQGEWRFWEENGVLRERVTFDQGTATTARPPGSPWISQTVRLAPPQD